MLKNYFKNMEFVFFWGVVSLVLVVSLNFIFSQNI